MNLDEKQILSRFEDCSSEALSHYFDEWRPELRRIVACRVGATMRKRIDPSDVLQEAFITAAKRIEKHIESPKVSTFKWMQSICFQVISVLYKRHFTTSKRSVLREASFSQDSLLTSIAKFEASVTSPSERMIKNEEQERILDLVSQLSENDQAILYLRHVKEFSNHEAALFLEIDYETAKKRYSRALKRLTRMVNRASESSFL